MNEEFVKRLKEKMQEKNYKSAELARISGVTKQNIGRILNATPHSITGALPKTTPETVEKLAKALDWDLNEALMLAGFAPLAGTSEYQSEVRSLAERLANGVMAAGFKDLEDSDLRDAFLADMDILADSMLRRKLEEQQKRKKTK